MTGYGNGALPGILFELMSSAEMELLMDGLSCEEDPASEPAPALVVDGETPVWNPCGMVTEGVKGPLAPADIPLACARLCACDGCPCAVPLLHCAELALLLANTVSDGMMMTQVSNTDLYFLFSELCAPLMFKSPWQLMIL